MVYRLSWLAGVTGGLFTLLRLERLLRSSVEGLPWEVILVAAAVLGAAMTWAALAYRLSAATVVLANAAALLLTVTRVAVPATTWFVFPTLSSFRALGTELSYALDVIRTGVAPVLPMAGVLAILTVIFWSLGALLAWGLRRDRPYVAVLAPLVVYLQFATMDRRRSGAWTFLFLLLFGLALLAVAADRRRRGTGLLTMGPGRAAVVRTRPTLAAAALAALMIVTVLSSNALAGLLPRSGLLDWRVPSALTGDYYGSISYNPFVGIHQALSSPTGTPLFMVDLQGEARPEQVYFRLLTLESFNGTQWYTEDGVVARPEEVEDFEAAGAAFRGPTLAVTQTITILALEQEWLPAAYSPRGLASSIRAVARGFDVRVNDGSLYFHALTFRGMEYTVESRVPQPDLGVLALGSDGLPSPVFAEASEGEEGYEAVAGAEPPPTYELPDEEKYLDLPEGIDPDVRALAQSQVAGLSTAFEKGLALESFFRQPGSFRYSTQIEPGRGARDLSDWLLEPGSPNYRTGYCEQFATAMAVLARQVGLPSRVVLGFTPGLVSQQGLVVVADRNAHAWVELWMPTQGWVRFDPTPRSDEVNPATSDELPFDVADYLDVEITTPTFPPGTNPPQTIPTDEELPPIPPILPAGEGGGWGVAVPAWATLSLLALVVAFGLIPALKWARRTHRMRALSTGNVSAAWWEIVDRLADLGEEPSPAATPAEVAAATDDAMAPLARVYGEAIYGPPAGRAFDLGRVVSATRALEETEGRLAGRYSWIRRVGSWYRLRSLTPRRWRRRTR